MMFCQLNSRAERLLITKSKSTRLISEGAQIVLHPDSDTESIHLRLQPKIVLFAVIHNLLQQFVIDAKFYYLYVFVVLKLLPLKAVGIISVDSCQEQQGVLVALPGVVVESRRRHLYYLIDDVAGFFQHFPLGIFFVVVVLSHAGGEFESVAVDRCPEFDVHDEFWSSMLVEDNRDNIYGLYSAWFGGGPEYLLIVVNCFCSDGVVNILHAKKPALVDDFLFNYFTGLILHKYIAIPDENILRLSVTVLQFLCIIIFIYCLIETAITSVC